jgi:hypothetical protein
VIFVAKKNSCVKFLRHAKKLIVTRMKLPLPKRIFNRRLLAAAIVIVTAVALILSKRAFDRHQAIQTIERLGGDVWHHFYGPAWMESLLGGWGTTNLGTVTMVAFKTGPPLSRSHIPLLLVSVRQLDSIDTLILFDVPVDDDDMLEIAQLSQLQELFLSSTSVGDDGLNNLADLNQLDFLNLSDTLITDEGLRHLQRLTKLRFLILDGTKVTDRGMAYLAGLPNLSELSVSNTGVTEEGVALLADRIPNLTISDD